jgi:plasmid stabilization system protein ParE
VARRIVFRPQAEDEVLEVRQWYESRRVGLGSEFGEATAALVARVAENPLAFPRVHGEIRRAVLSRFPYAIYFRAADDDIVVLAIHGRQDPSRWQRRV